MMSRRPSGPVLPHRRQRGMVLVVSLLLLLVVTLLAVAMFRGMGVNAKIAGNVREKQRALHAATAAEQYAEYWLQQNSAVGATGCTGVSSITSLPSANTSTPQICSNIPWGPTYMQNVNPTFNSATTFYPTVVPWKVNGAYVGTSYTPANMAVLNGGSLSSGQSAANSYAYPPVFYISKLGTAKDNSGTVYQIDAYAYGGTQDSVAVVESTVEVMNGGGGTSVGGP